MKKMALTTVGCRLNQYETEQIAAKLSGCGLHRVPFSEKADLYILNTCTVTGRADSDCRNLIKRAYRLNPDAVMVVAGCYAVSEKEMLSEMNSVDLVVNNKQKMELPDLLMGKYPILFQEGDIGHASCLKKTDLPDQIINQPNRPMVQIGTGCNQNCSYCVVPRVRGELVSFSSNKIIHEIKKLVIKGYHEAVLTAVHVGKYEYNGLNLAGLIKMILKDTRLSRLRLSSLEPNELDDDLIDFVANNPRVCRHLHLPLQSGSDRILKLMNRPYTRSGYLKIIERVKNKDEMITIGCDLIVGFPGETDEDFENSLNILNSGFLDYGHVFSYSDRPGTRASDMPEKINPSIIKERSGIAREISDKILSRHMKKHIGNELNVISQNTKNNEGYYYAVSDNYLKILLPKEIGGGKEIIQFIPSQMGGGLLI
ncbi:MAG: tRNA (N(6)-L-threonylcarbamoyladenosine(37)-C(2))-methylthiotransferase MtaB [Candidatus Zixiibacteriota bacterium]